MKSDKLSENEMLQIRGGEQLLGEWVYVEGEWIYLNTYDLGEEDHE